MKISFIIPTIGRESLQKTISSIERADSDEIIIIRRIPPAGDWGNQERNVAINMAQGDYLAFIDDDDTYISGHRKIMEDAIQRDFGKPSLFKIKYPNGNILWKEKEVKPGNVSSQMILVPNDMDKFYKFKFPGNTNMGDFYFISRWKFEEIIWREEIIVEMGHDDI